MRLSLALTAILISACQSRLPKDLGDHLADRALLTETPELAHLGEALRDPAGVTVEDLYRDQSLNYRRAPDPSALFEAERAAHAALPPLQSAQQLTVMSYNVGLLSRTYLGSLVEVPEIDRRRAAMAEQLFSSGYDVLLLQETWEWSDYEALSAAAPEYGYVLYGGSFRLHEQHGLTIAVRADRIDQSASQQQTEQQFDAQRKLEHWPGPNIRRGWMRWSFKLAGTDTTVHLYNLHATSFVSFWRLRDMQARQVGLEVAAHPDEDVVILGGDLNSGPYYRADIWLLGDGTPQSGWWRNASAYPLWLHYGEMYDVFNATQIPGDVYWGKRLPVLDEPAEALNDPYGDPELCGQLEGQVFTGTDCNALYFRQYAATEFPARLDHIMIHDPSGKARVVEAGLVFDDEVALDGGSSELSDHYGVGARLQIAAPLSAGAESPAEGAE